MRGGKSDAFSWFILYTVNVVSLAMHCNLSSSTEKTVRNFTLSACPILTRLMHVIAKTRSTDKLTQSSPYLEMKLINK